MSDTSRRHSESNLVWRISSVHPGFRDEDGFQTAEAIGIAAVGLLVLFGIWGAMSTLGVDVIEWIRDSFGVGSSPR